MDDAVEEEKTPVGKMTREELNGMVVNVVQNVVVQMEFLIYNILTGDLEDLENLGLRLEQRLRWKDERARRLKGSE
jgi:hypothetical protein